MVSRANHKHPAIFGGTAEHIKAFLWPRNGVFVVKFCVLEEELKQSIHPDWSCWSRQGQNLGPDWSFHSLEGGEGLRGSTVAPGSQLGPLFLPWVTEHPTSVKATLWRGQVKTKTRSPEISSEHRQTRAYCPHQVTRLLGPGWRV